MEAVLSGHARIALLLDGPSLASLHAGRPGEVVPRSAAEARLLLGGADDLELLSGASLDEVGRRLDTAVERMDGLHLALILLDCELSEETRRLAALDLEDSLADPAVEEFVTRILAGYPLPGDADLLGAEVAAEGGETPRVSRLIAELEASRGDRCRPSRLGGAPLELLRRRQRPRRSAPDLGKGRRLPRSGATAAKRHGARSVSGRAPSQAILPLTPSPAPGLGAAVARYSSEGQAG